MCKTYEQNWTETVEGVTCYFQHRPHPEEAKVDPKWTKWQPCIFNLGLEYAAHEQAPSLKTLK